MEEELTFSEMVLIYRRRKGLTQEELGKRVGVSKSTISAYESGKSIPDNLNTYFKLAHVLGVPLKEMATYIHDSESDDIPEGFLKM